MRPTVSTIKLITVASSTAAPPCQSAGIDDWLAPNFLKVTPAHPGA